MVKKTVEGKLMTGIGAGYLQFVKTTDISSSGLTYEENVFEVFAIDKAAYKPEYKSKDIYLSNVKADDMSKFAGGEITVDVGWFPHGFIEEASGMRKLANGVYVQGDSPKRKYFRWAFPVTDKDGGEVIYNFPKCMLEPVSFNAETETDEKKETYQQLNIKFYPVVGSKGNNSFAKIDLRETDKYSRAKLLEQGFYDAATLAKCLKDSGSADDTVVPDA